VRHFLTPLLLAATVFAGNATAAVGPQLEADSLSYDINTRTRTASGNAVFIHEGVTLEADVIYFDEGSQTAHAVGNVRVTRPDYRLVTNDLSYNMNERSFVCGSFRVGYPPMFLEGQSAHGSADRIELDNVLAYVGEPEPSTPTIAAEHMTLTAGKRLLSVGTKPGVGKYRLFRIPMISGKLEELPNMDASVDVGFEGELGGYASVTTEVPVSSSVSLGANVAYYTKRGAMAGPVASYRYTGENTELSGSVSSGFIKDQGALGYDYYAEAIPENRWFIQQRHKQSINDRVYITSFVNLMSDPVMMRDFRREFFNNYQYPDSYIEATAIVTDDIVVSALTRFNIAGNNYAMMQRLPELRIDLLTNPLPFGGLYQTGFFEAAVTDDSINDVHSRNQRIHTFYGISRPVSLTDWLRFTPKVGGFFGHYDNAGYFVNERDDGSATHYIGELGADFVANFHADWDFKSERWGIDGLRHILRPVTYLRRYGTAGDDDKVSTDYDAPNYYVQMPSIDLRDLEGIDDYYIVYNQQFARLGLENILETRDGDYSRELASFNLYHDSNFDDHGRDASFTQLSLTPTKFVSFSFENGFDTKPMHTQWQRARMTLKSADQWSFQLYADFCEGYYEDYVGSYFYQLSRDWGAMVNVGYDAMESEFDRLSLSVFQNIGSFWKIRYRVGYNKDDLRHDDFSFSIAVSGISF
jgi:lipopolysaccharide export system protein LptA